MSKGGEEGKVARKGREKSKARHGGSASRRERECYGARAQRKHSSRRLRLGPPAARAARIPCLCPCKSKLGAFTAREQSVSAPRKAPGEPTSESAKCGEREMEWSEEVLSLGFNSLSFEAGGTFAVLLRAPQHETESLARRRERHDGP